MCVWAWFFRVVKKKKKKIYTVKMPNIGISIESVIWNCSKTPRTTAQYDSDSDLSNQTRLKEIFW